MPKPTKDEKRKDFVERCIPILIKELRKKFPRATDAELRDRAIATCYTYWRRSK
jgi:hypothetical protein